MSGDDQGPYGTEEDIKERLEYDREDLAHVGGHDQQQGEDEATWLHEVVLDPKGKRPMVCYKFAETGRCDYGKDCKYSHDANDISMYKSLKVMGPGDGKVFLRGLPANNAKPNHTSGGAQPNYSGGYGNTKGAIASGAATGIHRLRSGDARRRA